jgi:hypothetical protein
MSDEGVKKDPKMRMREGDLPKGATDANDRTSQSFSEQLTEQIGLILSREAAGEVDRVG